MMRGRGGRWATPMGHAKGLQPMDPDATWAEEEFGDADLGDVRRNAGLGPLAAPSHQGLLAHTTLALTPEHVPLGLLQQQVWARDPDTLRRGDHKQRPLTE